MNAGPSLLEVFRAGDAALRAFVDAARAAWPDFGIGDEELVSTLYKVDRATAAGWLAAARESLVAAARERIRERLKLRDSEYESLVALVRSQLDVSIARHLA